MNSGIPQMVVNTIKYVVTNVVSAQRNSGHLLSMDVGRAISSKAASHLSVQPAAVKVGFKLDCHQ